VSSWRKKRRGPRRYSDHRERRPVGAVGRDADVHDGIAEVRSIARLNGRPARFGVFKAKGASDVSVSAASTPSSAKFSARIVDSRDAHFDHGGHTLRTYHSSLSALIEGSILAVVVVWLFLRSWRATLISALAIRSRPYHVRVHAVDELHAQPDHTARAVAGAGVLVDDASSRSRTSRHMRMGKSGYRRPSTRRTRSVSRWWPPRSPSSRCFCR